MPTSADLRPPRGTVVGGVDISRTYTVPEITEMYVKGRLGAAAVEGYIVRAEGDGTIGFVKADESTLSQMMYGRKDKRGVTHLRGGRVYGTDHPVWEEMRQDIEKEHPMVRRSAQEKKLSMVRRLLNTAQQFGTIPGLTDEQISTMIGEKWTTGVSVVTADMLDRVAARLLGQGEASNKEADSHRVTRAHPLA